MPVIKKTKSVKNTAGSHYTITTTVGNDPNKTVETVQVVITNVDGQPFAEPATNTLNYDIELNGMRLFKNTTINFDGDAVGFEYEMTFTMYNAAGEIIPSAVTRTLEVEQPMTLA
ncbi:MAG: hypothetical protein ACRBFS_23755 [Aureispira sp.]